MSYESSGSSEDVEPLSATAMFLRSLEEPPAGTPVAKEAAAPVPQAQEPARPGEFTRMFQVGSGLDGVGVPEAQPIAGQTSGQVSSQAFNPGASPVAPVGGSGPGEFTRIFHTESASQEAKTIVEPPPYLPSAAPAASGSSRKGFSTPGASDSASGEGSFTQLFKPVQAGASSVAPQAPVMRAEPVEPSLPNPAYVPESSWKTESGFGAQSQPAGGPSVTKLLSTLANPGTANSGAANSGGSSSSRGSEPVPYSPAPVPAYVPPPKESASTPEAGSVTRLIQRLAQAPADPMPVVSAGAGPVSSGSVSSGSANSGPGEFTRLISGAAFAPAAAQAPQAPPAPAQPAPAASQFPAAPGFAVPHLPQPAVAQMQPAAPTPHLAVPQMPKPPAMPAVPQVVAPKGKLEAMVPILLIVNTFLLVLVLVVVLFALKGH